MGIIQALSLVRAAERISSRNVNDMPLSSPLTPKHLERVIWADMAGLTNTPRAVTREQAMSVPAIAKARSLILGALGRQPLALYRGSEELEAPAWLSRSDTDQSPITRMCGTLDDLYFYGRSLWAIARDNDGTITDGIRIPQDWWDIDETGTISLTLDPNRSKQHVDPANVIMFEGLQDGLLSIAQRTITAAIDLERAWASRVQTPAPLIELHETQPTTGLTDEEMQDYAAMWEARRRQSGTGVTPYGLELRMHGDKSTDLFIEGRNALRLDIALFSNIPSTLLEGSQATASLTYSTQEGRRNELLDYSLAFWAAPIEARLSMDDVTPPGTRIGFNVEYFSQPSQPSTFPTSND